MAPTRVLVVDDDDGIRLLLRRVLEAAAYQVETAENGRLALEKVKTAPPDLIILDLMMPILDGWGVIERLRATHAPPPVVVLSAVAERDAFPQGRWAGVRAFARKPVSIGELLETCARVLGRD